MKSIQDYTIQEEIGAGMFSKVFKCTNKETGKNYACKMIPRCNMSRTIKKNLENEIQILETLSHPCIIKLLSKRKTENHFYIIFEYCNGRDLEHLLSLKEKIAEIPAKKIIRDIVSALKALSEI